MLMPENSEEQDRPLSTAEYLIQGLTSSTKNFSRKNCLISKINRGTSLFHCEHASSAT